MFKGKTSAFYTLGCKLNFSESSTISRQLNEIGFKKTDFNDGADLYVINTCSVTENANKECRRLVRKVKKISPNSFVIITGCFAQLKPKVISEMAGVDMVLGANDKFNLPNLLIDLENKKVGEIHGCELSELNYTSSFSLEERTRSFLKIQDGCDYPCTYCTIPLARGKSRCDTIGNILNNASEIAKNNIKEIVITGVNIGEFRDGKKRFADLTKELENVKGIERYRISSIEPNLITDEIIETVKTSKKFMPHFHIPLQSGSDEILGKMKRRYRTDLYKNKVAKIVSEIPDVCIGADVIVGFPGETDELFDSTLNFIKDLPISYLHVFSYSERENTLATTFDGVVPKQKRAERSKMLRILSNKLQRAHYQKYLGTTQTALMEQE
ncbi:MAG: tRNA (N(6)-L-threonylcarbamoyladenosine(37)-C(2))-methylthiotransferase MtaB, partial [Flavobacteriales bacterium]